MQLPFLAPTRRSAFAPALLQQALATGAQKSDIDNASTLMADGIGPVAALLRVGAVSEAGLVRMAALVSGGQPLATTQADAVWLEAQKTMAVLGLSSNWCLAQRLLVWHADAQMHCLLADWPTPAQFAVLAQCGDVTNAQLHWTTPAWFDARSNASLGVSARSGTSVEQLRLLSEDGPVIELVNQLLSQGALLRASDIHIEAREGDFVVRYRVDGRMSEPQPQPRALFDAMVVRVKILSGLDIAERRLPQDGRIQLRLNGDDFDIRVSVLPASYGEGIALRLLRSRKALFSMHDLGMQAGDEALFAQLLELPNGIVLVTGPTGSGKSTTLYTGLSKLNDGSRKIITVEDPVEYRIEGITQVQANASIGLDFASTLRSMLRHDPDVILIGEIRDQETAQIAVQAALTGHLVLSTLHTNSAVGSITRLIDMGVEPFFVSATNRALLAQRLVRRLCSHCSTEQATPAAFAHAWADAGLPAERAPKTLRLASPQGCVHCNHTGYSGRIALYELAAMNEGVRTALREHDYAEGTLQAASRNAQVFDLPGQVPRQPLATMLQDGLHKCAAGLTSLEEVLTVIE